MRKTNAYFTVEAALVMPVVFGVVLLTVWLFLFQYDRCLMEQSAGVTALRGCTLQREDSEQLVKRLSEMWEQDDRVFLAWKKEDARISLKGNRVRVECSGTLQFPFGKLLTWDEASGGGNDMWESQAVFENRRIRPVDFIRDYRKITGGK
ncbi:MAG: pilus assembly protein [Clostridium sp.]|nr:pilus assembly protein [Acetatifactor muris]MCM1527799.1 pilus assembly protein [Bacteroides sp.]MCM1563894.1 pilus assembly protein [Clostridium sp.]